MKFRIPSVPSHAGEENVDDYRLIFEVKVDVSPNIGPSGVNIESSQVVHSHVDDDLRGHLRSSTKRQYRKEGEVGETTCMRHFIGTCHPRSLFVEVWSV